VKTCYYVLFFFFKKKESTSLYISFRLQVDGDFLDRSLASKRRNEYSSVLFYASWCPFSRSVLPTYETLNSMFPQIEHVMVEKSSAMPRYDATNLTCFFSYVIIVG
jgi:thiol-disulfide isomerase/thioredoxin